MPTLKIVAIGDIKCGKTSLLLSYASNTFVGQYTPTVYDHYQTSAMVDGENSALHLWDTSGQDDFDRIRPLCFQDADVFLLCFSVVSRSSFENLQRKWASSVTRFVANPALLLVGLKNDLREESAALSRLRRKNEKPVGEDEAKALALNLKTAAYVECSAKTQEGLKNVFNEAISLAMTRRRERSWCVIL